MIEFKPITTKEEVLSFVENERIRGKCAAGYKLTDEQVEACVDLNKNLYFRAVEDDKVLGMVILEDVGYPVASLHLVLRTMGEKTREVISAIIDYAKSIGIKKLMAIFHRKNRAVIKLCEEFKFHDESYHKSFFTKSLTLE